MLVPTARKSLANFQQLRFNSCEISRFVRIEIQSTSSSLAISQRPRYWKNCKRLLYEGRILRNEFDKQGPVSELFSTYKESLSFPEITHEIKDLEVKSQLGKNVILRGYLGTCAEVSKSLYFIPLLSDDLKYSVQIISSSKPLDGQAATAHERLRAYNRNTPVILTGRVQARNSTAKKVLEDMKKITAVEVRLLDVQQLNSFPKDIIMTSDTNFPPEQRHLQIRQDQKLRDALSFRARAATLCRDFLRGAWAFTEIETPVLFKSTHEGAREFVVPTRRKGMAYALPQSPQQFKQILMASGIPRYYQMARCFRDEDLRADRQPEFTQLDLEMSFAKAEDVMDCIEELVRTLWQDLLQVKLSSFPRISYKEAMSMYGSDKPDLRFGMPIHPVGHLLPVDLISKISPMSDPIVEILVYRPNEGELNPRVTQKFIAEFLDSPEAAPFNENPDGAPGIFVFDAGKPLQGLQPFGFEAAEEVERLFEPQHGDLIILQARERKEVSGGSTPLGNLRLALHKAAVSKGLIEPPRWFAPLWVTNFPLFTPTSISDPGQGGTAGLSSTHHPFTSPKSAKDVDLLVTDPSKVIGDHYDLVINGVELGGGSRRIHNADMQRYIMEKVLKMPLERIAEFTHLLDVLRAGCPPHAGIALGFDRLVAVMLGRESVRDVIAFPKSGRGEDLLVKSPSMMTEETLKTYHLQLRDK